MHHAIINSLAILAIAGCAQVGVPKSTNVQAGISSACAQITDPDQRKQCEHKEGASFPQTERRDVTPEQAIILQLIWEELNKGKKDLDSRFKKQFDMDSEDTTSKK